VLRPDPDYDPRRRTTLDKLFHISRPLKKRTPARFGYSGRVGGQSAFQAPDEEVVLNARTAGSASEHAGIHRCREPHLLNHPLRTIKYVANEALADVSVEMAR
jgi:hypothetical protein